LWEGGRAAGGKREYASFPRKFNSDISIQKKKRKKVNMTRRKESRVQGAEYKVWLV